MLARVIASVSLSMREGAKSCDHSEREKGFSVVSVLSPVKKEA